MVRNDLVALESLVHIHSWKLSAHLHVYYIHSEYLESKQEAKDRFEYLNGKPFSYVQLLQISGAEYKHTHF